MTSLPGINFQDFQKGDGADAVEVPGKTPPISIRTIYIKNRTICFFTKERKGRI